MTNFFYTGIAINAVFFIALYAVNTTRVLSDFHREANWLLALLAAWVLGSLLFHRIGWNWLASGMAWFTAIILPATAIVVGALFSTIVAAYQRSGGPIRWRSRMSGAASKRRSLTTPVRRPFRYHAPREW